MHARTYRRAFALLLPLLGILAATVIASPAQAAPQPCSVAYQASGWPATGSGPSGFSATFSLTNNTATKTAGWRVEVHYQTGVEVTTNWNSEKLLDVDPVYVFGDVSWNREIGVGRSIQFGLVAKKTSSAISNTPRSVVCTPLF